MCLPAGPPAHARARARSHLYIHSGHSQPSDPLSGLIEIKSMLRAVGGAIYPLSACARILDALGFVGARDGGAVVVSEAGGDLASHTVGELKCMGQHMNAVCLGCHENW